MRNIRSIKPPPLSRICNAVPEKLIMKSNYEKSRPSIPAEIERAVKVNAGHKCEVAQCPEHTYLEIHHIDENRENNTIENLILLCDKHHKMAHARLIDRKSLCAYKNRKPTPPNSPANLDLTAYKYLIKELPENGLIRDLRNQDFAGRLSAKFISSIHQATLINQSPYSHFQDKKLEQLNLKLFSNIEMLSRSCAQKTYGAKNGGDHYEVPPEYLEKDEDLFYKEVFTLTELALSSCCSYDELIRLAIKKGLHV